jgi:hypothetical protein
MSKSTTRMKRRHSRDRGAALILTVIVIMVLTTLGMAMVTFTTTEEKTATTYRDSAQTRALAEAGVRLVQEMFRRPTDHNLIPLYDASASSANTTAPWPTYDYYGANEAAVETVLNTLGIYRHTRTGASPARYTGAGNRFFYPPFTSSWGQTFGGTYDPDPSLDVYDLKFNCKPPTGVSTTVLANGTVANCWLDKHINALLTGADSTTDWNLRPGKITDISFYAPPAANGSAYGISTVRVTAEKYQNADGSGALLARETIVALIGDNSTEPAVLGNGNMVFAPNGDGCGDGCENIHANGNINVGDVTGGTNPTVTATGTVSGSPSGGSQSSAPSVEPPAINPWDDLYKPTNATDLNNFYLATSGPLDSRWTNTDETDNTPSQTCGYSTCQDYGLEYVPGTSSAQTMRLSTDVPHIYKWNNTTGQKRWDDSTCATATGNSLSCNGLQLSVTPADDSTNTTWTDDTAQVPFNPQRVPMIVFALAAAPPSGTTLLVDGKFQKSANGGWNPAMAVIAAGSITMSSNTDWIPASSTQRVMWVAGRDISVSANCCAPANQCSTNLGNNSAQGIIAVHEQFAQNAANTAIAGLLIAENRVNHDPTINSSTAINIPNNGHHDYTCDVPPWNWTRATSPSIFSMVAAPN